MLSPVILGFYSEAHAPTFACADTSSSHLNKRERANAVGCESLPVRWFPG
jgi:hypothetical protein